MEEWLVWQRGNPTVKAQIAEMTRSYNAYVHSVLWGTQPPTKWALFAVVSDGENLIRMSERYWAENAPSELQHRRLVAKIVRGYAQVRERVDRADKIDEYLAQLANSGLAVSRVDPPGPKPGAEAATRLMWEIALNILNDPKRTPQIKHGWRKTLARMVETEAKARGLQYDVDSIAKMLRPSLTEWEGRNLPKN